MIPITCIYTFFNKEKGMFLGKKGLLTSLLLMGALSLFSANVMADEDISDSSPLVSEVDTSTTTPDSNSSVIEEEESSSNVVVPSEEIVTPTEEDSSDSDSF